MMISRLHEIFDRGVIVLYSLVSPPLHLRLIVADIISLLAVRQVRNTTKLLVIVDRLVFVPNAVDGIFQIAQNDKQLKS